jgi:hypothetical protein
MSPRIFAGGIFGEVDIEDVRIYKGREKWKGVRE